MSADPELETIRQQKKGLYPVRTGHRSATGDPCFTNRLILEDSPYLLQHAHNPVNWYAWGDEAFAAARDTNRPVFLSIGYATCHWCHVMEEESFDDEDVARFLNRHFISIKVDREQRPDLDDHFMTGVQLISGQGGWPMSNFLTPEGKPFFAATYLPKATLLHLLGQIRTHWDEEPEALRHSGEKVHQAILAQNPAPVAGAVVQADLVDQLVDTLLATEDRNHGGIGQAPKFPGEPQLLLLLDEVQRAGDAACDQPAWAFLRRALDGMLQGGIYDQVGGGFHRYSTDAAWQVPHFEKMLYNQAQLALIYTRAWIIGGEPEYRRIATETLDYVLAEMRSPSGGFCSATDADSEGEEGRFFTWPFEELEALFDIEDLAFLQAVYGATPAGNFEGRNILHLPRPLPDHIPTQARDHEGLITRLNAVKATLYRVRQQRPQPLRDDKEITEWNAMMIIALAEAGRIFERPEYLEAACAGARTILWQSDDAPAVLCRNRIQGRASIQALLADYGYAVQALLAIYDSSAETHWLDKARQLGQAMIDGFWDEGQGGFFNAPATREGPALGRGKMAADSTSASGNSAALMALVQLHQRTGDAGIRACIRRTQDCFAAALQRQPLAYPAMLSAISRDGQRLPASLQYAADGRVRIEVRLLPRGLVSVALTVARGWHIGSHDPAQASVQRTELIATSPSCRLGVIEYPKALRVRSGAGQAPLSQYQGEVIIHAQLDSMRSGTVQHLTLKLQACSESECLAPESVPLLLPAASVDET